jgi:glycosyltransferase involved in cell wall biosynthesis/tetratricopeptide (TPR) repeat protein
MRGPSVLVSADWDRLTEPQRECLRSVARATLGWGYRWGKEFSAEFSVSSLRPDELPAGVAMYNSPAPLREPSPGDIVVLFLAPGNDPPIAEAVRASGRGAILLAESHPLMAGRFGGAVTIFTSPPQLVESIYRLLESPVRTAPRGEKDELRPDPAAHPPVSIILFTYNGARYLGEALGSALDQAYDNFEVIVIDDGSTDGTEALVKSIESPRLRYVRQEHGGAPAARNRGVAEAKGEFIVWLGSDDVLEKDCLSSQVSVLARDPSADVVYGNMTLCDAGLDPQRTLRYEEWSGRNGELPGAMVRANVIPDGGSLVRKSCYERFGTYDPGFPRAHDYEWWSRLAGSAHFRHNDAAVYRWRWHGGNLGAGSGKRVDMRYESRIVEGLIRRYGLEKLFPGPMWKKGKGDHARALAHVSVAEILAGYGDTGGAIAHLEEGEKGFPLPEIRRAIEQLRCTGREYQHMADTKSVERPRAGSGTVQSGPDRLSVTYLISSILGVTGGNLTLLRQANALADRGHRVAIVTRTPRPSWFDIRAEVIQVAGNDPMWRSVPPSDVVISTYFINTGELASVSAPVKVYFAQGDQFVFSDTSASALPDVRKLHAAMKEMSRISYLLPGVRFVANSRALASRVEKLYGRKADAMLPVCVDQHVFAPLKKTPAGGIPRILIVGPDESGTEIEPLGFKGMAEARKALELLRDSCEKFAAVRISNTPPLIFRGFPAEFHIAPTDEGKRILFGTSDILIYASHYDSCPRPPLEAMAAGVAVVCTSTAGALEYCRDGENALLVPPGSPEQIAGAVRRLIRESDLREKIVRGGRETAARFPQEREWDELERLLLGYAGKQSLARAGVNAPAAAGGIDPVSAGAAASPGAESVASHMRRAARLMKDGDAASALGSALLAREASASDGAEPATICGVENFIGLCELGAGNLESAKLAFSRALEADNTSSRACAGLGEVFRLAGLTDQAGTMYDWALKNDPSNAVARKGLEALRQSEVPAEVPAELPEELPEEAPAAGAVPSDQTGGEDITAVHTDSVFARTIREFFVRMRPKKILETGTFMGTGTTAVIAAALRDFALDDSVFYSIEVNPGLHGLAGRNLEKEGLLAYVTLLNGLSIPRGLLPTREEIEKRTVQEPETISLYVDHAENERVENYFRETDFPGVADDLLGKVLGVFDSAPDFVLLDSGGHMGNIEFNYVVGRLKGPCYVMLDDIRHVKHHRSFEQLSSDPRFEVVTAVDEKAGFCLAKFTPGHARSRASVAPVSELDARLAIAGDLFGKKMFGEAIGALEGVEETITSIPEDARQEAVAGLETFRGMSRLGLSDLEGAKASFERALKIRPGSTQACAGLGEVLYLAGLDTEAKVMFEHAVALSAENGFGASGLARVNAALGLAPDDNALLSSPGERE